MIARALTATPASNPRLRALVLSLAQLGAIGLISIGVSGLLAGALGLAFGKDFISGDRPGVSYTAERCDEFLEYYHEASCEAAATAHHFDEVVSYRVAAGVVGMLGLGGLLVLARLVPALFEDSRLDPAVVPAVATVLFGLAAAGLLGMVVSWWVFGGAAGTGQLLSGGIVSLVACGWYSRSLLRALS